MIRTEPIVGNPAVSLQATSTPTSMPLLDLNPKLYPVEGGRLLALVFDCPLGHTHRFNVKCTRDRLTANAHIGVWFLDGELPRVSLSPSVRTWKDQHCGAHFSIVAGICTVHRDSFT